MEIRFFSVPVLPAAVKIRFSLRAHQVPTLIFQVVAIHLDALHSRSIVVITSFYSSANPITIFGNYSVACLPTDG